MTSVDGSANPNAGAVRSVALPQLDSASTVPLYYQLVQWVTRRVDDGTFPVGMVLDSEPKMARDLGLSRNTVRRAMGVLARRRIITRGQGIRHKIAAASSSEPDAATGNGGPSRALDELTSRGPLSVHSGAGTWRDITLFLPDRLTDTQTWECIHDRVLHLAAEAAEFVVDVRIVAVTASSAGWQKWTVAYRSSTDPVIAHTPSSNGRTIENRDQ